jgi:hypothetical protein
VSAQAKPISEVVKDFEQSLGNLRPSTQRVYVAGARAASEPLAEAGQSGNKGHRDTGLPLAYGHLNIDVESGSSGLFRPARHRSSRMEVLLLSVRFLLLDRGQREETTMLSPLNTDTLTIGINYNNMTPKDQFRYSVLSAVHDESTHHL